MLKVMANISFNANYDIAYVSTEMKRIRQIKYDKSNYNFIHFKMEPSLLNVLVGISVRKILIWK